MDLRFTDKQQAFREEARTWLAANEPAEPLQLFGAARRAQHGDAQHRTRRSLARVADVI